MNSHFEDKLVDSAKKSGHGRFCLFLLLSLTATVVAIGVVADDVRGLDMRDEVLVAIAGSVAFACYGMIWLYVCKLFGKSK